MIPDGRVISQKSISLHVCNPIRNPHCNHYTPIIPFMTFIISTKRQVSQVFDNHLFIRLLSSDMKMISNQRFQVEFSHSSSSISSNFPYPTGVSPWFSPPPVLSQAFDLPPALRQGFELFGVDAAVAVAVQAAEEQPLLGQRQPVHGQLCEDAMEAPEGQTWDIWGCPCG